MSSIAWRSASRPSRSRRIPVLRTHAAWERETQEVVVPLLQIDLGRRSRCDPMRNTCCWFSSSLHQKTGPFQVLGLTSSTTYAHAKQTFLKLALQHHPDTKLHHHPPKQDSDPKQQDENIDRFLEIRAAFESMVEASDGTVKVVSSKKTQDNHDDDDDTFEEWFTFETGGLHAYPERLQNPDLVAEIARTTRNMSPGGLDRGGMWQLAQEMQRVQALADSQTKPVPKRLESSPTPLTTTSTDSNHSTTTSRRRRKR